MTTRIFRLDFTNRPDVEVHLEKGIVVISMECGTFPEDISEKLLSIGPDVGLKAAEFHDRVLEMIEEVHFDNLIKSAKD